MAERRLDSRRLDGSQSRRDRGEEANSQPIDLMFYGSYAEKRQLPSVIAMNRHIFENIFTKMLSLQLPWVNKS